MLAGYRRLIACTRANTPHTFILCLSGFYTSSKVSASIHFFFGAACHFDRWVAGFVVSRVSDVTTLYIQESFQSRVQGSPGHCLSALRQSFAFSCRTSVSVRSPAPCGRWCFFPTISYNNWPKCTACILNLKWHIFKKNVQYKACGPKLARWMVQSGPLDEFLRVWHPCFIALKNTIFTLAIFFSDSFQPNVNFLIFANYDFSFIAVPK